MHSYKQFSSLFSQQRFIKLGDGETSDLSGGVVLDGAIEYAGLFCWQASNGMEFLYRDNFQYSSEHELARKMALATTVMGATSWGAFFFAPCVRFPPPIWLLISFMLLATCITEGITFKFFDSDWCQAGADCRLATSSKCGISGKDPSSLTQSLITLYIFFYIGLKVLSGCHPGCIFWRSMRVLGDKLHHDLWNFCGGTEPTYSRAKCTGRGQ